MTPGKAGGLFCERLKGADKTMGRPRRHLLSFSKRFRHSGRSEAKSRNPVTLILDSRLRGNDTVFFSDIDRPPKKSNLQEPPGRAGGLPQLIRLCAP